jgi:hypothetical protein
MIIYEKAMKYLFILLSLMLHGCFGFMPFKFFKHVILGMENKFESKCNLEIINFLLKQ